jgi:hypothetical protein
VPSFRYATATRGYDACTDPTEEPTDRDGGGRAFLGREARGGGRAWMPAEPDRGMEVRGSPREDEHMGFEPCHEHLHVVEQRASWPAGAWALAAWAFGAGCSTCRWKDLRAVAPWRAVGRRRGSTGWSRGLR